MFGLCALKTNYCWVCLYCIHAKLTSAEYVRNSCLHMKPIGAGNVRTVCTQKPNIVEYFQTVFTQNQLVLSMFGLFSRKTNKCWVCSDCYTQNQLVLSMSGLCTHVKSTSAECPDCFHAKLSSAEYVQTVNS